jgi:DNA-binding transcriptional regulator YdaS (Cro superfamily)
MSLDKQKDAIVEAVDAAIRSNRMEGLELSPDALAMLERVKKGEVSLAEFEKAAAIKYTEYGKGKNISYDQALALARGKADE